MPIIYGRPGNAEERTVRQLRRGLPGLAGGRSESASPVKLDRRRHGRKSVGRGRSGIPGTPGVPLLDDLLNGGHKMWARAQRANSALNPFGMSGFTLRPSAPDLATGASLIAPPITDDLTSVHYASLTNTNTGANVQTAMISLDSCQPGQGNGRGGFLSVIQFAFLTAPGSRSWFAGTARTELGTTTNPSDHIQCLGVGQDVGDSQIYFLHNDSSGSCTKTASGLGSVPEGRVIEVRVFWDPLSTAAEISVESLVNAVSTGYALHAASSNLPTLSMNSHYLVLNSGATGGPVSIARRSVYFEYQPIGRTIDS